MSDRLPLFLSEAVVTLYPANSDGTLVNGGAIWSGALVNHLREEFSYDTVKMMGSGEAYSTEHQVDQEIILTLDRSWILRKGNTINDFTPARNQQYVLQAIYQSDGYWYNRTYYGVTGRRVTLGSKGTNQFLNNQIFRAQYYLDSGGPGSTVTTPITAPPGSTEPFGFFRESPFVVGEYLLGVYSFANSVTLGQVEFIGLAPSSDTTLTLMVNGSATAFTLVIPAGTANTQVEASTNLNGFGVTAGQNIQWQITSGPDPADAAYQGALMMEVTNQ